MDRRFIIGSLLACIFVACSSQVVPGTETGESGKPDLTGTVNGTRIKDGNNVYGTILDTDGKPIPYIPVSDGIRFSATDLNGVYQFKASPSAAFVFYSLPSGYAIAQDGGTHLPAFYQRIDPSADNRCDFTLRKLTGTTTAFSFAVLGDIHIRDAATAAKFTDSAIRQIGAYFRDNGAAGPVFGVSLGDIINNPKDPDTYGMAQKALGSAEYATGQYLPFFTVIGNHDHDSRMGDAAKAGTHGYDRGTERRFGEAFGPTCYSFNIGAVHFVALDNYISMKGPTGSNTALASQAETGLTDEIYDWLLKDLACVQDRASKMVVVLQHCHVRGFTGIPHRDDLLSKLSEFHSAYIFSGHAHICESYKYQVLAQGGKPVVERIHGVPMGNFWYSRYNPDGSSAGYYIYKVSGNDFAGWEYRPLHDPDEQMRVYDSRDVYDKESDWSRQYIWTGESLFADGNYVLAHIYHGDEDWEVSFEQGGKSRKMTFANKRIYDYCVNCHLANDKVTGIRTSWKYHWDRSENWWYLKLDQPLTSLTGWKVVAKAKYPLSGETRTYTCDVLTRSLTEE